MTRRTQKALISLLVILVLGLTRDWVKEEPGTAVPAEVIVATPEGFVRVSHVSDGDTIKVMMNGAEQTVRMIGMNTPETVDPRRPVECFGKEASAHAKAVLIGASVRLEADATQDDTDKYGRILRYVFLEDGTNFNRQMIADGFAYEYTYEKPYRYQKEFRAAQADAQANERGLWAPETCNGVK